MVKYVLTAGFRIRRAGVLVPRECFVPRYERKGKLHKTVVGSHRADIKVSVQELICTPSRTEAQGTCELVPYICTGSCTRAHLLIRPHEHISTGCKAPGGEHQHAV